MPFGATRDSNRGPAFASTDLTIRKAFYINRDRGVRADLAGDFAWDPAGTVNASKSDLTELDFGTEP